MLEILLNATVTVEASTVAFSIVTPDARSVSVLGFPVVPITWLAPPFTLIPIPAAPVESISEFVIVARPDATLIPIVITSS